MNMYFPTANGWQLDSETSEPRLAARTWANTNDDRILLDRRNRLSLFHAGEMLVNTPGATCCSAWRLVLVAAVAVAPLPGASRCCE